MKTTQKSNKLVRYIDSDVYTEAKNRIRHIIDIFDSVVVAFSGGKDSLTVLHLVKEVYDDIGITKPVDVIFRDEELIPDEVIAFVNEYRQKPWIKMLYFATPMTSEKFVLGKKAVYIQWDENRRHIRPKPEFAISFPDKVLDQYTMDRVVAGYYKGKIAILTGVRADESLVRLRSCINKKNENYICNVSDTSCQHVQLAKPIYDWSEDDVFKYFCEKRIAYCHIYDLQNINGQRLRVSTPLHAESAKKFYKLRTLYPVFYQQLVDMFPDMLLQERYYSQMDNTRAMDGYEMSFKGIRTWIDENIPEYELNDLAHKRLREVESMVSKRKRIDPKSDGGYPVEYVFKQFLNGNYKRVLLARGK